MLLTPSYDGPPPLAIDGAADDVRAPFLRQRARLQELLGGLTDEQWRAPTRCEGWSTQDVVAHLIGTNRYWALSISAGLEGEPTRYLTGFDPAASPPEMVAPMRALSPAETFDQLVASEDVLHEAVAGLDDAGWATLAESPPGHVPIRLVANHGLWDAWIHERDIALPLGLEPVEEPDEVLACLRYAAALGPTLALSLHPGRHGALVVDATDLEVQLVVEVGDTVAVHTGPVPEGAVALRGTSVDLVEAFSIRGPLPQEVPLDSRWLLDGLATIFDAERFAD